jgi:hypothetical protein
VASRVSGRLAKHLEGEHDQKDHGKWAGKTHSEIREMLAGYPEMDLSDLSTLESLEGMSTNDYIDEWMEGAFNEQVEYYLNEWRDENPDAVFEPDEDEFRQMAYEALEDMADSEMEERKTEIVASIQEEVSSVYEVSGIGPNGEEWYSSADYVSVYGDAIRVEGTFYVEGEEAGRFQRDLTEDNAYRALLEIDDQFAGLGIAGAFNHQEEMAYLKSGLRTVTITAADLSYGSFDKPPGTYVWASQGYDWQEGRVPSNVLAAMRVYTTSNPEFAELPTAIQDTITSAIERARQGDADVPTPREISQLGRLPGQDWWPGKSIMAHSGAPLEQAKTGNHSGPMWSAVKRLQNPEGLRVSIGEVRSQQARAETVRAIEQHVTAWRRMNPQLDFGVEFIMVNGQPVPIEPSDGQVLRMMGM